MSRIENGTKKYVIENEFVLGIPYDVNGTHFVLNAYLHNQITKDQLMFYASEGRSEQREETTTSNPRLLEGLIGIAYSYWEYTQDRDESLFRQRLTGARNFLHMLKTKPADSVPPINDFVIFT